MLQSTTAAARRPILSLRPATAPVITQSPGVNATAAPSAPAPAPAAPTPAAPTPAPSGRNRRQRDYDRAVAILGELAERFPRAFRRHQEPGVRPALAIGIHRQIAIRAPDLAAPMAALRRAIGLYVRHRRYRAALIAGAPRLDLDGVAVGVVTEAERDHAVRRALADRQRAAERAPRADSDSRSGRS
jgi:ProP effector